MCLIHYVKYHNSKSLDFLFYFCTSLRFRVQTHLKVVFYTFRYNHLSIPIQNQKCLKNTKNASEDNNFPLAIWSAAEILSSLQMHSPAAHLSLPALLSKHHGQTVEKRAQASPFFFSPFINFREAGLSEDQCLCVIELGGSSPVPQSFVFCVFKAFLILNGYC